MYSDYQKLVVQDYERKKAANQLSLNLSHPTPAKLKEACLVVCSKRYSRKDGRILSSFFGEGDDKDAVLKAIKRLDSDKFKQIQKFLKNQNLKTSEKNIELLAWLIDFEPRPFDYGKNYIEGIADTVAIEKDEPEATEDKTESDALIIEVDKTQTQQSETQIDEEQASESTESDSEDIEEPIAKYPKPKIPLKILVSAIILIAIAGIIYCLIKGGCSGRHCMFWNVDHYEQISCTPSHGDTLVIALDSARLLHFRKITQPDTITYNNLGMVWYLKSHGDIEFFTSGGYHPVETKRKLKPITIYIIDQYIHPRQ